jgi:hypothetical protein
MDTDPMTTYVDDAERAKVAALGRTVRQLEMDIKILTSRIEQLEVQAAKPGKGNPK